jgi:hypothetical protein
LNYDILLQVIKQKKRKKKKRTEVIPSRVVELVRRVLTSAMIVQEFSKKNKNIFKNFLGEGRTQ